MKNIAIRYNVQLQKLVRAIKRDVDATLLPIVRQCVPEYTVDSTPVATSDGWSDAIVTALQMLKARWENYREASQVASDFVRSALDYNDRQFRRTTGISIFEGDARMQDYLKAATYQNVQLIQSIPERYLAQVENIVIGNMRTGMRPGYIVKALTQQFGVEQRRARFIARDQSSKITGEMTKQRQLGAGFSYFKWRDSDDSRVRDRHRQIAEKVTAYGPGVYRWDNLPLSDKGEPIQPGSDYNCFPGSSPLNIFYGAKKAFRHWYAGELTELITSAGERLVCTPNHPVLTAKGFRAADSLNVGDNLVRVFDKGFDVTKGHTNGSDVTFSEFFEAAQLLGICNEPVSSSGGEFHGDISVNQQIDIVSFDWELMFDGQTSGLKQFFELFFAETDKMLVGVGVSTPSHLDTVVKGLTGAPHSIVSSFCKFLTFLSGGFTHPSEHRFTAVGLLYSRLIQNAGDNVAGSLEVFSDCFNTGVSVEHRFDVFKRELLKVVRSAFGFGNLETPGADRFTQAISVAAEHLGGFGECVPVEQKLVSIVDKRVVEFWSGHVYNLEMGEGLFVAHNLAVSNCRCVAIPVTEKQVERYREQGKTAPGVYR